MITDKRLGNEGAEIVIGGTRDYMNGGEVLSDSSDSSCDGESQGREQLLKRAKSNGVEKEIKKSQPKNQKERSQYKQRLLILSNRMIGYRFRHLMNDLHNLLPHSKKDSKFDTRQGLRALNEIAEIYNCNNCIFFEGKKNKELYIWIARTPNGPTLKFRVMNTHTLDELNFMGNALKGARPLIIFDKTFDKSPLMKLVKCILSYAFATPRTSRKIKPFIDRVMTFAIVDNKIWFRNYQITANTHQDLAKKNTKKTVGNENQELSEIGPRFVLELVRVFDQGFGGSTLYINNSSNLCISND